MDVEASGVTANLYVTPIGAFEGSRLYFEELGPSETIPTWHRTELARSLNLPSSKSLVASSTFFKFTQLE